MSTDDHIIEPAGLFERHIPARFRTRAIERFPDGSDRWVYLDNEVGTSGLQSTASWPHEEWSDDPASFADAARLLRPRVEDPGHECQWDALFAQLSDFSRIRRPTPRSGTGS